MNQFLEDGHHEPLGVFGFFEKSMQTQPKPKKASTVKSRKDVFAEFMLAFDELQSAQTAGFDPISKKH